MVGAPKPPQKKRRRSPGLPRATRICWFAFVLNTIFICLRTQHQQAHQLFFVAAEKAYPMGCSHRDPTFYDYESRGTGNLETFLRETVGLAVKTHDDYLVVRRLGTGKFSDVLEAVSADNEEDWVVLKCLKPVSERKIKREVLVLKHASTLPNLARIVGVVLPQKPQASEDGEVTLPRMPTLVLEHAGRHAQWLCHHGRNNPSSKTPPQWLTPYEIRYYLYHLLVALDSLHAMGIMHRDVKPRNVLIDRNVQTPRSSSQFPLMLIDLGLADFYLPQQRYNVRVASRHYKSPELLVGYEHYDYAVDLWGVGCLLGGLLLRREPLFRGRDNLDQLSKVIQRLGTSDLITSNVKYAHTLPADVQAVVTQAHTQGWTRRRLWDDLWPSEHDRSDFEFRWQGLDLLNKLLVYDHEQRWTAQQAMQHRFFDTVRDQVQHEIRQQQQQHPTVEQQQREKENVV